MSFIGGSTVLLCTYILPTLYTTDEAWEIDKSELTLGKELGSGQFGVRQLKMFRTILCTVSCKGESL